jgi:hypothetical protein
MSESEREAFVNLDLFARRWFIATLSNKYLDQPVRDTFPEMNSFHPRYKEAKEKVRNLYKTWKNRTLSEAQKWMQHWLQRSENKKYA